MKKIVKIVTFYDDGTFSESTPHVGVPMPLNPPYNPSTCTKCGLKLEQVMGYVCTNYPCPCGLGGAWCGTTGLSK